jgi:hypothetical protein
MKLSYSIDPVARVVEFHSTGSPDFAEWSAVMEAILADPAFRPGTASSPIAGSCPRLPLRVGPASYGMVRMAQHLGSELPFQIQVFTDEVMARRWREEGGQERPFRPRR